MTQATTSTGKENSRTTRTVTRAGLRGQLTGAQRKRIFRDSFIREVSVHYQRTAQPVFKVRMAEDVAHFVRQILSDNSREHFISLFLDGGNQVASYSIVSIGTANMAPVHPRELFQRAIGAGAVSLIVAHNHPSGNLEPSDDDRQLTSRLKEVGELLGMRLLDHVIVTDSGHYSFSEANCF